MLCLVSARQDHLAAAARWREEQANRPTAGPRTAQEHLEWLREMREQMRRDNEKRTRPDPVCKRCGVVHQAEDACEFFPSRCSVCGIQRLEKLVRQIIRRRGRRQTIKLLRRLAAGK